MTRPCLLGRAMLVLAAPVAVSAATSASDVSGKWSYEVAAGWKKGPCPAGKGGSGETRMTQEANEVTLVFVSGRTCRPKSMCTFTGTLSGRTLTVRNAAPVDDEGGQAKNEISLTFDGRDAAVGSSESSYAHPGGMQCRWGSKLTLKR